MAAIIVKVTREQHRKIKRDAKERDKTISDHVRDRLLHEGLTRGERSGHSGTKREA